MADARITEITIPAGEATGPHAFEFCMWADIFVKTAIDEYGYEPAELPDGAHDFADLWTYYGECLNGGHAQYRGNTNCDIAAWRRASRALKRMELSGYQAILDDFIRFSIDNQDKLDALYEEDEALAADRLFRDFDDRLYALDKQDGGLRSAARAWLLRQNWIVADPDMPSLSMNQLRQMMTPHPLIEEREAARKRRNVAENHGANQALLRRLLDQLVNKAKR